MEKADARIRTLSDGQKQRVGIAQALLNDPELLIVDEPTVGLDPEERIRFRNLFNYPKILMRTFGTGEMIYYLPGTFIATRVALVLAGMGLLVWAARRRCR